MFWKIVFAMLILGLVIAQPKITDFLLSKDPNTELDILSFSTDKKTYHSKERMNVTIVIKSSDILENVSVKVYGIKDRHGNYRLNAEKSINLSKGINTIPFTYTTPSCYGCAGINPGSYRLTGIAVSYTHLTLPTKA